MRTRSPFRSLALVLVLVLTPNTARAESDATLESLSLSVPILGPGFTPGTRGYVVFVGDSVTELTITAKVKDADAKLLVDGRPLASGAVSEPIPLGVGRNTVTVDVVSGDGTSKNTYSVRVFRAYPGPTWARVQEYSPWQPRDSAGGAVFGGKMWLLGGFVPDLIADVWSTADGQTWAKSGAIDSTMGINLPVTFVHDNKMWVTSEDGKLNSSADGNVWTAVTSEGPWRGRYGAGGAVFKGRMWVMGGLERGRSLKNDVWSSTDGVNWTLETAEAPWSKRQLFGMVQVFDDKLWVLGGGITKYHPFKAYTDVWSSADGRTWTKVCDATPWPARIWSSSIVYRNRLWVFGGFSSEPTWRNFNDLWYSADGVTWKQLTTETVWSPRHALSAFVFGDHLWVVAGNSWPLMNDVWCLDIPGLMFLSQPVLDEFLGAQYVYQAFADFNNSRRKVRYRLMEGPTWLRVEVDSGRITGTPTVLGDFKVTVEAYDEAGETTHQSYKAHVSVLD